MTHTQTSPAAQAVGTASRVTSRARAVGAAVVAAVAVWAVARLAGVDLVVRSGDAPVTVGVGAVVGAALVASLLGWALMEVLERLAGPRAGTIWTMVALVVLVASLGGPIGGAESTEALVALVAMHVSVAAVLVATMRRTAAV